MILSKKSNIILLSIILIFAFIVRLYGLTSESIWLDEGQSIHYASQPLIRILNLNEPNPPLYIIILSIFIKIFGISEFWVRLPSVIFGVLSVLLIYLFGKKIFNERIGLIASLILAFSAYNIFYSQEARMYTLLIFLSLLSMYFFINYFQTDNKNNSIYYFISTTLLLYSHYFSMLIIFVQNIFFLIMTLFDKKYKEMKRWSAVQSLIFLAYLPALINLVNRINNYLERFEWVKGLGNLKFINYNFSGGWELNILFPLILLYGFYFLIKNKKLTNKDMQVLILLIFWTTLPIIITVIYSLIINPIFLTRYVIFSSIPLYMLVAFSIDKLNKYFIIATSLIVIIFSSFYITNQIKIIDKEPWRNLQFYVKSIAHKEDVIMIEPGYYLSTFAYYHIPKCLNNLDLYNCASNEKVYTIWNDLEKERSYLNYANRIIYIRVFTNNKNEDNFLNIVIKNFGMKSKRVFPAPNNGAINIYLFET